MLLDLDLDLSQLDLSWRTSKSRAESVVVTIEQPVQDACEDGDVVV